MYQTLIGLVDMPNFDTSAQRNVQEVRVTKDRGFFGITKPVMVMRIGASDGHNTFPFFIAEREYRVIKVVVRYESATNNADTLQIKKAPSGTATTSGTNILSSSVALNSTASTNITAVVSQAAGVASLLTGDALALITSGTLDGLFGLTVALTLRSI